MTFKTTSGLSIGSDCVEKPAEVLLEFNGTADSPVTLRGEDLMQWEKEKSTFW